MIAVFAVLGDAAVILFRYYEAETTWRSITSLP